MLFQVFAPVWHSELSEGNSPISLRVVQCTFQDNFELEISGRPLTLSAFPGQRVSLVRSDVCFSKHLLIGQALFIKVRTSAFYPLTNQLSEFFNILSYSSMAAQKGERLFVKTCSYSRP